MSKQTKEPKSHIRPELENLEARLEALEAHLSLSRQQAAERLEHAKKRLRDFLDQLKAEFAQHHGKLGEKKQKMATAIDEFKLQIVLGKAETRDALEKQREKFEHGLSSFEKESEIHIREAGNYLADYYHRVRDLLHAEFDAAEVRAKEEMSHQGDKLEKRMTELREQLRNWQKQLSEQHKKHAEKWDKFREEVKPALDQIAAAFRHMMN